MVVWLRQVLVASDVHRTMPHLFHLFSEVLFSVILSTVCLYVTLLVFHVAGMPKIRKTSWIYQVIAVI